MRPHVSPEGTEDGRAVSRGFPCSLPGPWARNREGESVTHDSRHTCSWGGLDGPHIGFPVPRGCVSPAEDEQLFRSVEGQTASEDEEESWQEQSRPPQALAEVSLVQPSGCESR